MTMEYNVSALPDYPALSHLASALWNDGHARGAAILVGAGFSRNAERAGGDTRLPPLWSDLAADMAKMVYPDHPDDAPRDPLRLAEEFRTYLGPAALLEFLREHVPDTSWRPGPLHTDLMNLPWADVLTTNYDTLLERASDRHRAVRNNADLAQVRGPRVIKLHGSIDGNASLIITEEDYRSYPERYAAFVNTARQVFIENELCLIGFSGDDPNFLQWSGWIRDHLGDGARRIYLVGSLGLSQAKRRLLEGRNVAPIDFAPLMGDLPKDEAESQACKLFLAYLASSKPPSTIDWKPAESEAYAFIPADFREKQSLMAEPSSATTLVEKLAAIWHSDRSSCPDWLVMPRRKRQDVDIGTGRAPWGFVNAMASLPLATRARLLGDAAWRYEITLEPLDSDLSSAIADLVTRDSNLPLTDKLVLLRALLREARLHRDESRFREIEQQLAHLAPDGSDARAELIAQRLLWARDGLDLAAVSSGLSELAGPDPIWRLLRAALHCECGETELARRLVKEACSDLTSRQRMDPRSMFVASRHAWAKVFGRALELSDIQMRKSSSTYNDVSSDYDAFEEIDQLYRELRASRLRRIEEPQGYEPLFEPGAYRDHTGSVIFRSAAFGYEAEAVFRLADASCLPLRANNVDILASLARDALESEPLHTLQWHLRLIRTLSYGSPALNRHFDNVSIARLDPNVAHELTDRVLEAVKFWQSRNRPGNSGDRIHNPDRLRILLEILSRLVVRADPSIALTIFRLGCDMATDLPDLHPWLYEPLGDLLKWSLTALPPVERRQLSLDCLQLHLPRPDSRTPFRWPEPAAELFSRGVPPRRPQGDPTWRACVATLLAAVGKSGPRRTHAVHRLAYLFSFDCLEPQERTEFGHSLWSSTDPEKGGLPSDVDLYPHVVASLPGTQGMTPLVPGITDG